MDKSPKSQFVQYQHTIVRILQKLKSGYFMVVRVKSGQDCLFQVKSGCVSLVQFISCQVILSQVVRLAQVSSG
jgi:hypothetical protein